MRRRHALGHDARRGRIDSTTKEARMKRATVSGLVLAAFVGGWELGRHDGGSSSSALAAEAASAAADTAQLEQLHQQIKHFEGLVPDQAAVMSKVGYHFTNLYVALQHDNWPLADFYLGETRNNIAWAIRTKPIRKDPQGRDLDLGAIAQAIDGTQLAALQKAIAAKDKAQCLTLYHQTLDACYGCHTASGKPYLKPQEPAEPEVKIIRMSAE
jgi:hypothetical protein